MTKICTTKQLVAILLDTSEGGEDANLWSYLT
ncbi:hypothetical protein Dalk_4580 [Desulfatibacillum aliphaticivorans]|uniref:Uncharacterized protein n=1 Tax=Desulfatibacillum aliphaticivorans TaxID=218208 RepID=B8FNH7_DESAL|nr:hypothetical protein Dalk_4580 [Desulfatibacillum aliphaticivorans]